jgi:ribonuclease I
MEKKKDNFDERYHASYASKLKTVPLDRIETAIAKAIGELTHDKVECTIINFNVKSQLAEIVITLDTGTDKRYSR